MHNIWMRLFPQACVSRLRSCQLWWYGLLFYRALDATFRLCSVLVFCRGVCSLCRWAGALGVDCCCSCRVTLQPYKLQKDLNSVLFDDFQFALVFPNIIFNLRSVLFGDFQFTFIFLNFIKIISVSRTMTTIQVIIQNSVTITAMTSLSIKST